MKKFLSGVIVSAVVLTVLTPLLLILGIALVAPSQSSESYYGALDEKVERLYSVKGPKLVVIGGSSVAFGLDSELLETYSGLTAVNFGLYADLGTKLMLELAEDAIGQGDVILISPELSSQALSLYFNGASTWRAFDDDPALLRHLDKGDLASMWGALWGFSSEKLQDLLFGAPTPTGVYASRNFNEWGDVSFLDENGRELRTTNVIGGSYYQSHTPINPSIDVWEPAFLDYLNAYIEKAEAKGARVYFAYCPMNRFAISDESGACIGQGALPSERIEEYEAALREALDCEILGSFTDYVYEPNYFYDSNFHLNAAGVSLHSRRLLSDLLARLDSDSEPPEIDGERFPLLPMPELRVVEGIDPTRVYTDGDFLFQIALSGEATIVGVSESGLEKPLLAVPRGVKAEGVDYPVTAVGDRAFSECRVTETVVFGPAFLSSIGNRIFSGSSVSACYLYCPVQTGENGEISLSQSAFLEDAPSDLTLYIAEEHYFDYALNYFWSSIAKEIAKRTEVSYLELVGGLDTSDFLYRENGDGSLTLVGVAERAKEKTMLAVPAEYGGRQVSSIASGAFSGTPLEVLVISPDVTDLTLETGALGGSSVMMLYLYSPLGTVTAEQGFDGGMPPESLFIFVYESYYADYAADAAWSALSPLEVYDGFESLLGQ